MVTHICHLVCEIYRVNMRVEEIQNLQIDRERGNVIIPIYSEAGGGMQMCAGECHADGVIHTMC